MFFSRVCPSVILSIGSPRVIITHDALDLTVLGPPCPSPTPDNRPGTPPAPSPPLLVTSGGHYWKPVHLRTIPKATSGGPSADYMCFNSRAVRILLECFLVGNAYISVTFFGAWMGKGLVSGKGLDCKYKRHMYIWGNVYLVRKGTQMRTAAFWKVSTLLSKGESLLSVKSAQTLK